MLEEGIVHILASDAHDVDRRPPNLGQGRDFAAKRVGEIEAGHLVVTRPRGVLMNQDPATLIGAQTGNSPPEMVYSDVPD